MEWATMRRTQFAAAIEADAVVVVPVASIEQHAGHLPIDTDSQTCFEIARRAAQATQEFPVLVLPPVWTGYSPHHMKFPGSITLEFKTFLDVLTQVARSIAHHGFRKILFLNGHGGNTPVVSGLRTKLAEEDGVGAVGINYWDLPGVPEAMRRICPVDGGSVGHAGETETSLQLALRPELVDAANARWIPGASGDARAASAEKGRALLDAIVPALVAYLRSYHDGTLEKTFDWTEKVSR